MGAFRGAVDIGAHAIETDVHLSADGVVVLSHVSLGHGMACMDRELHGADWAPRAGSFVEALLRRRPEDQRLLLGLSL